MNSNQFLIKEFVAHAKEVTCLTIGPKSKKVFATGGNDNLVNIWQVGNLANEIKLAGNSAAIESLCFDPDEDYVISGSLNGSMRIFDLSAGKTARTFAGHKVNVKAIQHHPYAESILASGSVDKAVKLWDYRQKSCIQTLTGHEGEITCIRFSPDGKMAATAAKDGVLMFWDLAMGKFVNSIKLQGSYISSFEFNPAQISLAAITSTRNVRFWDAETMEPIGNTPSESINVKAISYTNLGTALCSTAKETLRIWDVAFPIKQIKSIDIGWERISEMKISNDTQVIAAGFASNYVSVWALDIEEVLSEYFNEQEEQQDSSKQQQQQPVNNNNRGTPMKSNISSKSNVSNASNVSDSNSNKNNIKQNNVNDYKQPQQDYSSDALTHARKGNEAKIQQSDNISGKDNRAPNNSNNNYRSADAKTEYDDRNNNNNQYKQNKDDHANNNNNHVNYNDVLDSPNKPEVKWNKGNASNELINSMNESFFNRLGGDHNNNNNDKDNKLHNKMNIEDKDGGLGDDNMYNNESFEREDSFTEAELAEMLPPAVGFDDHTNNSNNDKQGKNNKNVVSPVALAKPKTSSNTPIVAASPSVRRDRESKSSNAANDHSNNGINDNRLAHNYRHERQNSNNHYQLDDNNLNNNFGKLEIVGNRHMRGSSDNNEEKDDYNNINNNNRGINNNINNFNNNNNKVYAPSRRSEGSNNNNNNNNNNNDNVSESKKCEELLERLLKNNTVPTLLNRYHSLHLIWQLWSKGDIMKAIENMRELADSMDHDPQHLMILTDFFKSIELKTNGLSLDACVSILPILEKMLFYRDSLSSEHIVFAIFKSLTSLVDAFGELIRTTRALLSAGSVDVAREARLNKCNICFNVINKVRGSLDPIRNQYKRNIKVLDILESFHRASSVLY